MAEERFEFEGVPVAYHRLGRGAPVLMLHGSGPGASSLGNWRTVLEPLAERFEVYAMDLVGFGRSGRKPAPPFFDYSMWVRQARAMLARIPGELVGVIGHSISGSIALSVAAQEPRIAAVMTTGTMGGAFTPIDQTRRCWTGPRTRQDLVETLKGIIHDASVIDEPYLAAREPVVFAAGYADYFDAMFQGDKQQYVDAARLAPETLARVRCPVRLLHGREDQAFPPSNSIDISSHLPQADLVLLGGCSHSVAFERPRTFVAQAHEFLGTHLTQS